MFELDGIGKSCLSVHPFTFGSSSYSRRNDPDLRVIADPLNLASLIFSNNENLGIMNCKPYRSTYCLSISSVGFKVYVLMSKKYRCLSRLVGHNSISTTPLLAISIHTDNVISLLEW